MSAGGLWTNFSGTWFQATGVYLKRASGWVKVQEAHVKSAGVWKQAYVYDRTPPDSPILTVDLVDKHLKISVRQPGLNHDPDLAEIRVLHSTTDFPAGFNSVGYERRPDDTFPHESWSSYYYNGYKVGTHDHASSIIEVSKAYPLNAGKTDKADPGKHYFSAFAMDLNGNWSLPSNVMFNIPKDYSADVVARSSRFSANNSGTWTGGTTFAQGRLIQGREPLRTGSWYHGAKFTDAIGEFGTASVSSAKIYAYRDAEDTGEAEACIYVFWHDNGVVGSTPPAHHNTTLVGKLAKGVGKWFDLPQEHLTALEAKSVHGFGLANMNPAKAAATENDFSTIIGTTESGTTDITAANTQSGEVYVIWTEKP